MPLFNKFEAQVEKLDATAEWGIAIVSKNAGKEANAVRRIVFSK